MSRKITSGAVIMTEGMRLHTHSRDQTSVKLSSCEAEVMEASEGIKESLCFTREIIYWIGFSMKLKSRWTVVRYTNSFHRQGGRTYEVHRFENLGTSRLDYYGRYEIEEDTENIERDRHVDAYIKCEGTGDISIVDESQELQ